MWDCRNSTLVNFNLFSNLFSISSETDLKLKNNFNVEPIMIGKWVMGIENINDSLNKFEADDTIKLEALAGLINVNSL
jgi:hypothetical protein